MSQYLFDVKERSNEYVVNAMIRYLETMCELWPIKLRMLKADQAGEWGKVEIIQKEMDPIIQRAKLPLNQALLWRINAKELYETREDFRKVENERLSKDFVRFINHWCYTSDPRIVSHGFPSMLPFILWPKQEEFLMWVDDAYKVGRSWLAEKSRGWGITWLLAAYYVWHWVYHDGFIGGFGSRDKDAVDKIGDPDTIFAKVRFIIYNLPTTMLPKSYQNRSIADQSPNDSYLRIVNPERETTIRGEGGDNIGAGGRSSIYVVDESALVAHPKLIDDSLSYTTMCRGDVSCVTEDTFVITSKGIRQVADFVNREKIGGYVIPEYSVYGRDKLRLSDFIFNNGYCKTKKIVTQNAFLECSHEHKLWACVGGKFGWVKSKDLRVGDYVSIEYGQRIFGNNDKVNIDGINSSTTCPVKRTIDWDEINGDVAYFLGAYMANGCSDNDNTASIGRVTITSGNDMRPMLDRLNLKYSSKDGLHYVISSVPLTRYLVKVGIDTTKHAPEKEIPLKILSLSEKSTIYFLRGMFDGDGYSNSCDGHIGISLSSKKMILQLRAMLLNLGILSSYHEEIVKPNRFSKKETISYRLYLYNKDAINFYNLIGFSIKYKQDNLTKIKTSDKRGKSDIFPYYKKILTDSGVVRKVGVKLYTGSSIHKSREAALSIKEKILSMKSNCDLSEQFDNLQKNIKWLKIKKIEDGAAYTYDFSLPNVEGDKWCHSVLYNGLIGHQTVRGMNEFGEKRHSGRVRVFTSWFYQDPSKYKGWRENKMPTREECAFLDHEYLDKGELVVAQELLIDYSRSVEDSFIPADWIKSAVDFDLPAHGYRQGGFDVSGEGENKSVYATRVGPVLFEPHEFSHGTMQENLEHALSISENDKVELFSYDADGIGGDIWGHIKFTERKLKFDMYGIKGNSSPSEKFIFEDNIMAKDKFRNKRSENYWNLRERFRKTYEHRQGVKFYDYQELISIPNNTKLITQLSQPKRKPGNKIQVESKTDMRSRGVKSPDYADSCVNAFADPDKSSMVISEFNYREGSGVIEDFQINFEDPVAKQFVSIVTTKDMKTYALGCWWIPAHDNPCLKVYCDFLVNASEVKELIANIRSVMCTDVKSVREWICNDEMISSLEDGKDNLWYIYKKEGVYLRKNYSNDYATSIVVVNRLFANGIIKMHKRCERPMMQVSNWRMENGKPQPNLGFAMALCQIVNRLHTKKEIRVEYVEPNWEPRNPYKGSVGHFTKTAKPEVPEYMKVADKQVKQHSEGKL